MVKYFSVRALEAEKTTKTKWIPLTIPVYQTAPTGRTWLWLHQAGGASNCQSGVCHLDKDQSLTVDFRSCVSAKRCKASLVVHLLTKTQENMKQWNLCIIINLLFYTAIIQYMSQLLERQHFTAKMSRFRRYWHLCNENSAYATIASCAASRS